ncbi:hypothetical protein MTR_1g080040 [Medicago truncatula]|uniref:FAR1 DNA-binding domain protein n=1 Tax=Medicago truncatula TaxID=3880 RepID=G7I698_MEDTR|nr:hypothetical protein MTR_1g080040 [Medicago truncatula]
MTMQCERSGEYKPPKTRKKPKLEGTGSRKCNCLFRLKCFFEKRTQEWWIAMLCGVHDHNLAPNLSGHLLAGRLRGEEKQRVIDITKSLAKPRNILTDSKEKTKKVITGEFVKFGPFGSFMCDYVIVRKTMFLRIDYVVLSDNLVKLT